MSARVRHHYHGIDDLPVGTGPGKIPTWDMLPPVPPAANTLSWPLGTPWIDVDAALDVRGRMAIVLVEGDPTNAPRVMTKSTTDPDGLTNLDKVVFIGVTPGISGPAPGPVIIDFDATPGLEVQLGLGGGLTSQNVLWQYGARLGSGAGLMEHIRFDFNGGGLTPQPGYTGDAVRLGKGDTSTIALSNGARIGDAGLTDAMIIVTPFAGAPPYVLQVFAVSGSIIGPRSFSTAPLNPFAPYGIPVSFDGSVQYDPGAHVAGSFSIPTLLDAAARDSFDPTITGILTATDVQGAIDELSVVPAGGSPDGYYLTFNANAPADSGSVFTTWAALQVVAAALVAAGSSFRIFIASDLTFPVGPSFIGQGLFAAIADPKWFIDVPDGVTWIPSAIDFAVDGSLFINFGAATTRVLTAGAIRFTIANGAFPQAGFGSLIAPFLINGGGGEGGGGAREIIVTSGATIDTSILPLIEADSDDTSIRVFIEDQSTTISPATFGQAIGGTGTLSFFWRDPTVRTGTIESSDQTTTWLGGPVKYMQRLFPFTGQVAAAGGLTRASDSGAERVIATCSIPGPWLNETNLTARLRFAILCTLSDGGVAPNPSLNAVYVRARLGAGGPLLFESGPSNMVVDGVDVVDLTVRTVTPGVAGVVDVFGFKSNVPFDGGGTAGSFINAGVAVPFILPSSINVVVTVTFNGGNDGGLNVLRCDGATLDLAGAAVIP